jgi:hypothetical protein
VSVGRAVGRRNDAVEPRQRRQRPCFVERDEPARDAELVLERRRALERLDVLLAVEEKEVTDAVEVDLEAGPLREPLERLEAAEPNLDVQRVGELRAHATGRLARRSRPELRALDQEDVDAGLGEVEGDARPDHPAADDDHLGTGGQLGHEGIIRERLLCVPPAGVLAAFGRCRARTPPSRC